MKKLESQDYDDMLDHCCAAVGDIVKQKLRTEARPWDSFDQQKLFDAIDQFLVDNNICGIG